MGLPTITNRLWINHNMKKNKFGLSLLSGLLTFSPVSAFAQGSGTISSASDLRGVIDFMMGILSRLVPLLIGAAVVVFLYGVMLFIAKASAGNADGRAEGIKFMIFGIIGIAVMVSVWGLVAFVTNTFGTGLIVPQFRTN